MKKINTLVAISLSAMLSACGGGSGGDGGHGGNNNSVNETNATKPQNHPASSPGSKPPSEPSFKTESGPKPQPASTPDPQSTSTPEPKSTEEVLTEKEGNSNLRFNFVKLDIDGHELPEHASQWRCIKDKTTGLTWEVKQSDESLSNWRKTYTNEFDTINTEFINVVNEQRLCGFSDWRLPAPYEFQSLKRASGGWFPKHGKTAYWFSFKNGYNLSAAIDSDYETFTFNVDKIERAQFAVQLVRSDRFEERYKVSGNGKEITDTITNLTWETCDHGMKLDENGQCIGTAINYDSLTSIKSVIDGYNRIHKKKWRLPTFVELVGAPIDWESIMIQASRIRLLGSVPLKMDGAVVVKIGDSSSVKLGDSFLTEFKWSADQNSQNHAPIPMRLVHDN